MQYLLLIYEDPDERRKLAAADEERILPAYRAFTAALATAGQFRAGDALEPVTTATTVRVRAGKRLVTDGPFAETKEHLLGYYLIDARDLDEALTLAERVPTARFGAIEVRPIRRVG